MRFSDIPIRGKLIIAFILIGILPLTVVGLFAYRLGTQSLLDRSFEKLAAIQSFKKKQVETAFKRFENDLKTLAGSERLGTLIGDLENYRHKSDAAVTMPFSLNHPVTGTLPKNTRLPTSNILNLWLS